MSNPSRTSHEGQQRVPYAPGEEHGEQGEGDLPECGHQACRAVRLSERLAEGGGQVAEPEETAECEVDAAPVDALVTT